MQRIFRVQLGASLPEMRLAWRAFRDDPSLAHANVMIAFVHRLAGSAGMIGFGDLGERAAAIEIAIRSVSAGATIPEDLPREVSGFFSMIAELTAGCNPSGDAQP